VHPDDLGAGRSSASIATKANLTFAPEALGWLRLSSLPHTVALMGPHRPRALGPGNDGEETLARSIGKSSTPSCPPGEGGLVIFIYSFVFTAGVSFFASMDHSGRDSAPYFGNLISGLSMNFVGPYNLRLAFEGFGRARRRVDASRSRQYRHRRSMASLNRVLGRHPPHWFRHPHPRFGTSYRMLNLVVGLPAYSTILLSRGDIFILGEAYALV